MRLEEIERMKGRGGRIGKRGGQRKKREIAWRKWAGNTKRK